METVKIAANTVVFKKGDAADCMYLIRNGKIRIVNNYGKPSETELAILTRGKFFGEMGVIDNVPRSADAVTTRESELLKIEKDDFTKFVENNPSDVIDIMKNLSNSLRKTNDDFKEASRIVSEYVDLGFKNDTTSQLKFEKFSKNFKEYFGIFKKDDSLKIPKTEFKAGDIIFNKGDRGANMYLVIEGTVDMYIGYKSNTQVKVGTAEKGDIFGEMGVIEEERRSATAVAVTDVKLKSVMSSDLLIFIESNPEDAIKILKNLSGRLRKTTEDYMDILKSISDFVAEEKKNNPTFESWNEFCDYSDIYNSYQTYQFYNPYVNYNIFF